MNRIGLLGIGVAVMAISSCALNCRNGAVELSDITEKIREYDNNSVVVHGMLCVDFSTAYIVDDASCSDFNTGIAIPLDLSQQEMELARSKNQSLVSAQGVIHAPPKDALLMNKGILLGASLDVERFCDDN